jgi:hypothetical protein
MSPPSGQSIFGFYESGQESTTIDKTPVRLPDCLGKDELEWHEYTPIDASRQIRLIELLPSQKNSLGENSLESLRCKIHAPTLEQVPAVCVFRNFPFLLVPKSHV